MNYAATDFNFGEIVTLYTQSSVFSLTLSVEHTDGKLADSFTVESKASVIRLHLFPTNLSSKPISILKLLRCPFPSQSQIDSLLWPGTFFQWDFLAKIKSANNSPKFICTISKIVSNQYEKILEDIEESLIQIPPKSGIVDLKQFYWKDGLNVKFSPRSFIHMFVEYNTNVKDSYSVASNSKKLADYILNSNDESETVEIMARYIIKLPKNRKKNWK